MIGSPLATGPRGLLLPGHVRPVLPSQFAVPNGLVGYWGLDPDCLDLNRGLALDLSGNGKTGTLINSPTLTQGMVGTALNFASASSQSANLGLIPAIGGATYATISGWIWRGSTANIVGIGFASGSTTNRFGFFWYSDGNIYCYATTGGTSFSTSGTPLAGVGWHYISLVFNGNSTLLNMYIDGIAAYSSAIGPSVLPASATLGNFTIGGDGVSFGPNIDGAVDDLRLYAGPPAAGLDPWGVQTLYRAGLAGRRDAGVPLLPALFLPPALPAPLYTPWAQLGPIMAQ